MKVLYNVTVGIDPEVEQEWLHWMVETHIPEVMETGLFFNYKIYKVLNETQDSEPSYSIQYFSEDIIQVQKYLNEYAPNLIKKHQDKYSNKHVAFRTLLQEIV